MTNKETLREKLVKEGYRYLHHCDTEASVPETEHYILVKSTDVDCSSCINNVFIDLSSDDALTILDRFLNPIAIHPNPLEI